MSPDSDATADTIAIEKLLFDDDIDAFVDADWSLIEPGFDADEFCGYSGTAGTWTVRYPSLEAYRDHWLEQAATMRTGNRDALRQQLRSVSRIVHVDVNGDRAVARKDFDGAIDTVDGPQVTDWTTYYFLRRRDVWQVTGFAGYLPRATAGRPHSAIEIDQHVGAGPYSPGIVIASGAELVVLSGQGPLDADGSVVGNTIAEQTSRTLKNCATLLQAAGTSLDKVVKVQAFLNDLDEWDEFNTEYRRHFPGVAPARTTVGVKLLLGMKVELDMWALR